VPDHRRRAAGRRAAKQGRALPPRSISPGGAHTPSGSSGASSEAGAPAGAAPRAAPRAPAGRAPSPRAPAPPAAAPAVANPFSGFAGAPGWFQPAPGAAVAPGGGPAAPSAGVWSRQASAGSAYGDPSRWDRSPSWADIEPGQSAWHSAAQAPVHAPGQAAKPPWHADAHGALAPARSGPGLGDRSLSGVSVVSSAAALWGSRRSSAAGALLTTVSPLHSAAGSMLSTVQLLGDAGAAAPTSPVGASDGASVAATAGEPAGGAAMGSPDVSIHGLPATARSSLSTDPAGGSPQAPDSMGGWAAAGAAAGAAGARGPDGAGALPRAACGPDGAAEPAGDAHAAAPLSEVSTSLTAWLPREAERLARGAALPGAKPKSAADADLARRLEAAVAAGLQLARRGSGEPEPWAAAPRCASAPLRTLAPAEADLRRRAPPGAAAACGAGCADAASEVPGRPQAAGAEPCVDQGATAAASALSGGGRGGRPEPGAAPAGAPTGRSDPVHGTSMHARQLPPPGGGAGSGYGGAAFSSGQGRRDPAPAAAPPAGGAAGSARGQGGAADGASNAGQQPAGAERRAFEAAGAGAQSPAGPVRSSASGGSADARVGDSSRLLDSPWPELVSDAPDSPTGFIPAPPGSAAAASKPRPSGAPPRDGPCASMAAPEAGALAAGMRGAAGGGAAEAMTVSWPGEALCRDARAAAALVPVGPPGRDPAAGGAAAGRMEQASLGRPPPPVGGAAAELWTTGGVLPGDRVGSGQGSTEREACEQLENAVRRRVPASGAGEMLVRAFECGVLCSAVALLCAGCRPWRAARARAASGPGCCRMSSAAGCAVHGMRLLTRDACAPRGARARSRLPSLRTRPRSTSGRSARGPCTGRARARPRCARGSGTATPQGSRRAAPARCAGRLWQLVLALGWCGRRRSGAAGQAQERRASADSSRM